MRRKEREITDREAILGILRQASVCHIAWHDEPYPYILPMNYGLAEEGGTLALYLHAAHEGYKLELTRKNPHVAFEVLGAHQVRGLEAACSYTMDYASVIGQGILSIVPPEEREAGLAALMRQVAAGREFTFDARALESVTVLRLDVQAITGKQNGTIQP